MKKVQNPEIDSDNDLLKEFSGRLNLGDNDSATLLLKEFLTSIDDPDTITEQFYSELSELVVETGADHRDAILDVIADHQEAALGLIQFWIDQKKVDETSLQLVELLPSTEGIDALDNAILDLWFSPEEAHSYYSLGYAWSLLANLEAALAAYDQALTIDPEMVDVYNERGALFQDRGEYERALPDFDKALSLDPEYKWALANKGSALRQLSRFDEAQVALDKVLELNPEYVWAYNERGLLFEDQGKYEQAIKDYDKAISLDPDYKWAHANKASSLSELGRYEESRAAFNKVLQLDPEDVWAYNERGLLYENQGQYDRALQDYDRAIDLDPGYKWAYANKGSTLSELDRYEESQAAFDKALKLDPGYVWAYNERGLLYEKQGQHDQALQDYDQAIDLDPEHSWSYANKGSALSELGRYEESQAAFDKALELYPEYVRAYNERGILFADQGKYNKAIQDYDTAIALDPEYKWAYANKGSALRLSSLHDEALTVLKKALNLDPEYVWVLNELGLVYLSLGDEYSDKKPHSDEMLEAYRKALKVTETATRIQPDDPYSHWYKGSALHSLNALNKAVRAFNRAIDLIDDETSIDLATLYEDKGDTLQQWGQALKLRERLKQASEAYQFSIKLTRDPSELSKYYTSLGDVLIELKDYEQAISATKTALDHDPSDARSLVVQGKAYLILGKLKEARQAFEKVLELESGERTNAPRALIGLGILLDESGKLSETKQAYDKVLRNSGSPRAEDYLDRAEIFEEFSKLDHAEADRKQAVEIDPGSADANNTLAWMYVDSLPTPKNLKKALTLAKRAVKLETQNPKGSNILRANYLDTLGWVQFKLGEYEKAVKNLAKSLNLQPLDYEVRYHMQQAKQKLKKE